MNGSIVKSAIVVTFCNTLFAGILQASPIGNADAGRKYYIAARDLTPWSAGLQIEGGSREARVDSINRDIETSRAAMYVGYDFMPWATAFVKVGSNNTKLDSLGDDDYSAEIGFGMRVNLLHHEIMDPTLFENRILVNAAWEFTTTEASRRRSKQDYRELQASLTMSIVNDIQGDKRFLPFAISLFFGPVYSLVDTSGTSTRDELGLIVGLEAFYTKRISFRVAAEQIGDATTAMFGLHAQM